MAQINSLVILRLRRAGISLHDLCELPGRILAKQQLSVPLRLVHLLVRPALHLRLDGGRQRAQRPLERRCIRVVDLLSRPIISYVRKSSYIKVRI